MTSCEIERLKLVKLDDMKDEKDKKAPKVSEGDRLLKLDEVAEILGISLKTCRRKAAMREIPIVKGVGVRVRLSALWKWIAEHEVKVTK